MSASEALVETPPMELPGLLALVRYVVENEGDSVILGLDDSLGPDDSPRAKNFLKTLATALEGIQRRA